MAVDEDSEARLIRQLVTAVRAGGIHLWEPFVAVRLGAQDVVIFHPRIAPVRGATLAVIDRLGERGLLDVERQASGARLFQITMEGFAFAAPE